MYIILSLLALLIWLAFIIGSAFDGGVGPYYERAAAFADVAGFMLLGLLSAVLGIVGGIKGLAKKPAGKRLFITIAVLVTIVSIPYFFRDEIAAVAGVLVFLAGILPTLIYIIVRGKRKAEVKDISNEEKYVMRLPRKLRYYPNNGGE